jgi:hypothetical protein
MADERPKYRAGLVNNPSINSTGRSLETHLFLADTVLYPVAKLV